MKPYLNTGNSGGSRSVFIVVKKRVHAAVPPDVLLSAPVRVFYIYIQLRLRRRREPLPRHRRTLA